MSCLYIGIYDKDRNEITADFGLRRRLLVNHKENGFTLYVPTDDNGESIIVRPAFFEVTAECQIGRGVPGIFVPVDSPYLQSGDSLSVDFAVASSKIESSKEAPDAKYWRIVTLILAVGMALNLASRWLP
jgi:hypothetical protein